MHEIRTFLALAARQLGRPLRTELTFRSEDDVTPHRRRSWSAFITYGSLKVDARYSYGELPGINDLGSEYVADCSWDHGGPVVYADVAHVVIPRFFDEEYTIPLKNPVPGVAMANVTVWRHEQDIDGLSKLLRQENMEHGYTEYALEVKRY